MFVFDGSWLCVSLVRDIDDLLASKLVCLHMYMKYLVSCNNIQEVYTVTTYIVCLYKQDRQSVSTATHT